MVISGFSDEPNIVKLPLQGVLLTDSSNAPLQDSSSYSEVVENKPVVNIEPPTVYSEFNEPTAKELNSFNDSDSLPVLNLPKNTSFEAEPKGSFESKLSDLKDGLFDSNRNSVGVGMFYKTRTGSTGLDSLDTITLPSLDFNYYPSLSHHFYGHINILNMSNRAIENEAMPRYGANAGGNIESIESLVEPMIGYEYTNETSVFTGEFGTKPSPVIVPEIDFDWKLSYLRKAGKLTFNIAYVNKSVKDSMLSRIGDKYYYQQQDSNKTITYGTGVRGGVSKNGFEFGLKHSKGNDIFAGNLNYYNVTGFNISPNKEVAMTLLYLRLLEIEDFQSFMVGPIFIYDNFYSNSGYFTVGSDGSGNGGYFSPKNFILLGVYFDMAQMYSKDLFWKIKGNIGIMNFTSGADKFRSETKETSISGFGYEVKGFVGYKIDDSIQLLGGIGYQSSGPFQSLSLGLTAIYYFGKNKSNNVDDLLYSNTLGEMAK